MNILILSVGTRNKVVQYFKENNDGKVIATDCSKLAPALYDADNYYIVKRMDEEGYLDQILEICKTEEINAVFSLIDPELQLLADNKKLFESINVLPIVSDSELIKICSDKYLFFKSLIEKGFNTVKTYDSYQNFMKDYTEEKVGFPVFVKPRNGSASIGISKVTNEEELKLLTADRDDAIIQEYCNGQEFGVDVYIDLISKDIKGYFSKEKIRMRAGETDKSISYEDEKLRTMIYSFVKEMGFIGFIDIDVFKQGSDYLISEVNPRFGGGYLHAYEMGINMPQLAINNIQGKINENEYVKYKTNVSMLKFSDVVIVDLDEKK